MPPLGSPELPSRGSALHKWFTCKPCAFVRQGVCKNDVNCPFCHLCEPGEKKRRRKVWLMNKREAQGSESQSGDSSSSVIVGGSPSGKFAPDPRSPGFCVRLEPSGVESPGSAVAIGGPVLPGAVVSPVLPGAVPTAAPAATVPAIAVAAVPLPYPRPR